MKSEDRSSLKRRDSGDGGSIEPSEKKLRTRSQKDDEDQEDEEEKERVKQLIIRKNLQDLMQSRVVGDTFLQDGPCYLVAANLPLCRECKVPSSPQFLTLCCPQD